MSLKDIEKLKEKVDKDPNSKMFVPLAEEYRKEAMLDEAIAVLLTGLENQPGYTSARVSLGKIYLEKGMVKEAKAEFENVIKVIPDNLYAHKKLAEIYRDAGEREHAIKAFRTVVKLNAMDEDALMNLNELEGEPKKAAPVEAAPVPEKAPAEEPPTPQEAPVEPVHEEAGVHEALIPASEAGPAHSEEDLESFKAAIFGGQREEAPPAEAVAEEKRDVEAFFGETAGEKAAAEVVLDEAGEEISMEEAAEEAVGEISLEESAVEAAEEFSLEEPVSAAGEISMEEAVEEAVGEISLEESAVEAAEDFSLEEPVSAAGGEISLEEPAEGGMEEISFGDVEEELGQAGTVAPSVAEAGLPKAIEEKMPAGLQQRAEPVEAAGAGIEAAEKMIAEGNFGDALGIYKSILARNPDDRKTLQRVEELRALLKMMGKDKEVLIDKLNSFMENVKKRRDEFLRSS